MFIFLHGYQNKDHYDNVREYCLRERVNEEYLRTLIKKLYSFRSQKELSRG